LIAEKTEISTVGVVIFERKRRDARARCAASITGVHEIPDGQQAQAQRERGSKTMWPTVVAASQLQVKSRKTFRTFLSIFIFLYY